MNRLVTVCLAAAVAVLLNALVQIAGVVRAADDTQGRPAAPESFTKTTGQAAAATRPADTAPSTRPADAAPGAPKAIRIHCGGVALTDADGHEWEDDRGFADGTTEDRGRLEILEAKTPDLYRTERWGMTAFSVPVPNGKYTVRLHFAETWNGIKGPGQRVFDVNVAGHEIKDIDIFKEVGERHPLVKTVEHVDVTDGKLGIKFTEHATQNHAEVNGIEIIPEP